MKSFGPDHDPDTDLFTNIVSLSVHTLPSAMLESLGACGIEALILVPERLRHSSYLV